MSFGLAPLAAAFRVGSRSPVEALERCLAAAERARGDRALISFVPSARAEAEAARVRFAQGHPLGPLDGIPVVVKDCIDVAGLPTTNGTRFLLEPAALDSTLVSRLRAAGAVVFAKANMHEFGIQPTGVNPHHGTPVNPWSPERIPGGSSSGAAVSVASGLSPIAVGTDAGGSIRVPAVFNGLVGFKPTFAAVPTEGVARLTQDLDHAGPIAWTVEDATLLFEVLAGVRVAREVELGRVAVLGELFGGEASVDAAVRAAIDEVFGELPSCPTPIARWSAQLEFTLVGMQSGALIGDLLQAHAEEMGADARTILQLGMAIPGKYQQRAVEGRLRLRAEFDRAFQSFDLLLAPGCGAPAPKLHALAAATGELDTAQMARFAAVTFPANLAGLPACVVPCVREGAPVGLQVIGRAGDDARVLAAARRVEAAFGPRRPPRWFGE